MSLRARVEALEAQAPKKPMLSIQIRLHDAGVKWKHVDQFYKDRAQSMSAFASAADIRRAYKGWKKDRNS